MPLPHPAYQTEKTAAEEEYKAFLELLEKRQKTAKMKAALNTAETSADRAKASSLQAHATALGVSDEAMAGDSSLSAAISVAVEMPKTDSQILWEKVNIYAKLVFFHFMNDYHKTSKADDEFVPMMMRFFTGHSGRTFTDTNFIVTKKDLEADSFFRDYFTKIANETAKPGKTFNNHHKASFARRLAALQAFVAETFKDQGGIQVFNMIPGCSFLMKNMRDYTDLGVQFRLAYPQTKLKHDPLPAPGKEHELASEDQKGATPVSLNQ